MILHRCSIGFRPSPRVLWVVALCLATIIPLCLAGSTVHAALLDPGGLLVVTNNNELGRYSFTGVHEQTLPITGLPPDVAPTAVAIGVAVVGDRLFVGFVSVNASFPESFAEVNPVTGVVISFYNTVAPYMTSLGDDGTNLLLLNSVNGFEEYTYTPGGAFVSMVVMERPFPGNYQANGVDGDGDFIFSAYLSGNPPVQPIVTNSAAGPAVTYFATNIPPSIPIRGLAFNPTDNTFWAATSSQFHHYSRSGDLLATVPGTSTVTGLEVLPTGGEPIPTLGQYGTAVLVLALILAAVAGSFKRWSPTPMTK